MLATVRMSKRDDAHALPLHAMHLGLETGESSMDDSSDQKYPHYRYWPVETAEARPPSHSYLPYLIWLGKPRQN
jgi:hypothetical protein